MSPGLVTGNAKHLAILGNPAAPTALPHSPMTVAVEGSMNPDTERSMTVSRFPAFTLPLVLACAALLVPACPAACAAEQPHAPWADRALPAGQRAEALVAAMTLDEKLQLVHSFFPPLATGKPGAPGDIIPSAGHVPGIPRLGIPTLRESDASLGVANQVEQRKGDVATALPAGLATAAASFDPDLALCRRRHDRGRGAGQDLQYPAGPAA